MPNVLYEITPLSDKDCFYITERTKQCFDYPLHHHREYEINFISRGRGARRIVGDSIESIDELDLVLVGPDLEHVWEHHECQSSDIYEVTLHFTADIFNEQLLSRTQLAPLKTLLEEARLGVKFDTSAILSAYSSIERLLKEESGFHRFIHFLQLLHQLATSEGRHVLASSSFAKTYDSAESRRVKKVKEYIEAHYAEDLSLDQLSALASMTPTAFSRFFRVRTGTTVSDYLMHHRLGHVVRLLVDTSMSVAEICFQCGFNNVSNFNRLFKREKGCTPKEFREAYRKNTILV